MTPRDDGVRVVRKRGEISWAGPLLVLAMVVAAGLWLWRSPRKHDELVPVREIPTGTQRNAMKERGSDNQPAAVKAVRVRLRPALSRTAAGTAEEQKRSTPQSAGPQPTSGSATLPTTATNDSDVPSGIALFPPPGTNPPKSGLIVPDEFELPPGYVRHYQVTDDGKPLPPILMFHPDTELVDADGNPIPLPPDLVVPPELAPPGFPREMLQVPETTVPWMEPPPSDADSSAVGSE